MKVRIPLLLLGPYLRPFLEGGTVIAGALTVILMVACCVAKPKNREDYLPAIRATGAFFIIFCSIFALFCLLGMP